MSGSDAEGAEAEVEFDVDDFDGISDGETFEEQTYNDDDFTYPKKKEEDELLQMKVKIIHLKLMEYDKKFEAFKRDLIPIQYENLRDEYNVYFNTNVANNKEIYDIPIIKSDLELIDAIIAFIETHKMSKETREIKLSASSSKTVTSVGAKYDLDNDFGRSTAEHDDIKFKFDDDYDYMDEVIKGIKEL